VFCIDKVIFFGFVISSEGVFTDPEKVKAILLSDHNLGRLGK